MDTNEITRSGKYYVGYDYKTVNTTKDRVSLYLDAYRNFGWMPDDSVMTQFGPVVTCKLKRDRKILNKAELTRLERHFEACMDEISALESSKTKAATMYSLIVGVIGTAFMAGSVFAVTAEPPTIWLCVLLGIPGIIGWVFPYRLYQSYTKKRAAQITPHIEKKYDEIHDICEKGNALIH